VLDRLPGDRVTLSAAAFYTELRPLVRECRDRELLLHLAGGIPFHITYRPGRTDLLGSLNQAGEFIKDWPRGSTTVLVIADGGNVAASGLQALPPAAAAVVVAGVGDPARGRPIDGHVSRQDGATLAQVARRLGGRYFDCNTRHLPDEALRALTRDDPAASAWRADRRLAALALLAAASALLCLLPLALEFLGSAWRPSSRLQTRLPT
jgi:Ca-activated chloride channel homolog